MSSTDLKNTLRKFEFPDCAREALDNIDRIVSGRNHPSNKQLDLLLDLVTEFIFCEFDRRSSRRTNGLNSLQELQLIDVICENITGNSSETTKNTKFLILFSGTDSQKRIKVLSTFASMAISALNSTMLMAVGTWLQQTGCSSPLTLQLVENLIKDHFYLSTSNHRTLKSLADIAPQFVANFMTAVTELYLRRDSYGKHNLPPRSLIEVITYWVYSNSKLCMSAQLTPAALPPGSIPMAVVTPLAGLIHWCALAPVLLSEESESIMSQPKKTKFYDEETFDKCAVMNKLSDEDLYKKLHVGVLLSLCEGRRTQGSPTAINAQHLANIANPIQSIASQLLKAGVKLGQHKPLQESLDRIAQSTQVALGNGCVYGNLSNLLATLDSLPENRLLRIVIKTHMKSI